MNLKKLVMRGGIAALVYAAVLIFFLYIFGLENTNIRISSFLAPIFGIMWGPAGAVGIGIGNFIADTFSPYFQWNIEIIKYILGSMGNALMAFLSYIMWHTLFLKSLENPFAVNLKNIVRYILIQLIVAVITSFYLTLINTFSPWLNSAWDFFFLIMLNNWDINILIGLPVLLMLMSINYEFYRPASKEIIKLPARTFNIILAALVIISAYILSFPVEYFDSIVIGRRIFALGFFIYLLRPIPEITQTEILIPQPIFYKLTKGFCLFMVCLTIFLSGYSFLSMSGDYSSSEIWLRFYENTFLVLHFTLTIQLGLIWYIERNIVKPLSGITETAAQFINSDPEKDKIKFEVVHSGDEIELLSTTLKKMLDSIYKYIEDLRRTLSERAKTQTQLDIAKNIQASLLPEPDTINDEFYAVHIEALMDPALTVGGDFYDFKALDDDHIFIVVSDISDKGISASLFMTITYTLIHHKISFGKDISLPTIFAETNNQLCENNDTGMFATAVGVIYEISTGKLIYVNAGHTSPLIVHGDGTFEYLKKRSGAMLGSIEDIPFKKLETSLKSGDVLVLYSDGVTEALNEQEEFFLEERLAESVSKMVLEKNIDNIAGTLREDLAKFVGKHEQSDDITIVTLLVK